MVNFLVLNEQVEEQWCSWIGLCQKFQNKSQNGMVLVAILEVGFFLIPAIVKWQIMEEHWFTVKEQ